MTTTIVNSRYISIFPTNERRCFYYFGTSINSQFSQDLYSHEFSSHSKMFYYSPIQFQIVLKSVSLPTKREELQMLLEQNTFENLSMKIYNALLSKSYSFLHEKVEDCKTT